MRLSFGADTAFPLGLHWAPTSCIVVFPLTCLCLLQLVQSYLLISLRLTVYVSPSFGDKGKTVETSLGFGGPAVVLSPWDRPFYRLLCITVTFSLALQLHSRFRYTSSPASPPYISDPVTVLLRLRSTPRSSVYIPLRRRRRFTGTLRSSFNGTLSATPAR